MKNFSSVVYDYDCRYQDIKTLGTFYCSDTKCQTEWHSTHTWVRFDLYSQTTKLFGQACPNWSKEKQLRKVQSPSQSHLQLYNLPKYFNEQTWLSLSKKAVQSKLSFLYFTSYNYYILG